METTEKTSEFLALMQLHITNLHLSSNDVLDFELEAAGTQFQASGASRTAFETLWTGNVWMIYRNIFTNVLHWDFVSIITVFAAMYSLLSRVL